MCTNRSHWGALKPTEPQDLEECCWRCVSTFQGVSWCVQSTDYSSCVLAVPCLELDAARYEVRRADLEVRFFSNTSHVQAPALQTCPTVRLVTVEHIRE